MPGQNTVDRAKRFLNDPLLVFPAESLSIIHSSSSKVFCDISSTNILFAGDQYMRMKTLISIFEWKNLREKIPFCILQDLLKRANYAWKAI